MHSRQCSELYWPKFETYHNTKRESSNNRLAVTTIGTKASIVTCYVTLKLTIPSSPYEVCLIVHHAGIMQIGNFAAAGAGAGAPIVRSLGSLLRRDSVTGGVCSFQMLGGLGCALSIPDPSY